LILLYINSIWFLWQFHRENHTLLIYLGFLYGFKIDLEINICIWISAKASRRVKALPRKQMPVKYTDYVWRGQHATSAAPLPPPANQLQLHLRSPWPDSPSKRQLAVAWQLWYRTDVFCPVRVRHLPSLKPSHAAHLTLAQTPSCPVFPNDLSLTRSNSVQKQFEALPHRYISVQ